MQHQRFSDKTVIVTGGAGGVGRALVRLFAREGALVTVADVSESGCEAIRTEMAEAGYAVDCLTGDLCHRDYCERLVEQTVARHGGLDILLNNAGIIPRGTILETTDEMWFAALDVNLTAAFYLCRAAIPHMQKRGGGAIVNTASVWGTSPGPGHVAYCTSKGALAALTRNLGLDHARDGIRINAVCPHEIDTPMLRSGFERRGLDPDRAIEQLNRSVPLGRIATAEDIADVIAFLASDAARYVAGATLDVTGAKPVAG